MGFEDHRWFLALAAVALVAVLRALFALHLARRLRHLGGSLPACRRSHAPLPARIRAAAWWAGLVLLVVACARPHGPLEEDRRSAVGANIYVCIDCSTSMTADDVHPTRTVAARRKIVELLRRAPNHRLGLIPFARLASLRCTPLGDANALRPLAEDCGPDLYPLPDQGTRIGEAVRYACRLHNNDRSQGQAVLVVSDGVDPDAESVARAAAEARAAGIPVYGILVGDPQREATIVVRGEQVAVPPDPSTLDVLATATGGRRVTMTTHHEDLDLLLSHIDDHVGQFHWEERERRRHSQRYQGFALAALILLALAGLIPTLSGWPERKVP